MLADCHAHLFLEEFDADREEVIKEAQNSGVGIIVNAGIDNATSKEAILLANRFSGLYATAGIHPQAAPNADYSAVEEIRHLARSEHIVAIGEIGLDYYRGDKSRSAQLDIFEKMLSIAADSKLPVVIHCRSAEEDMMQVLEAWSGRTPPVRGKWRGIRHCFGEDLATALRYIELGFMLSLGAYIGYPSSKNLRTVFASIPQEALLLETDSPYLPPQRFRGKRNQPSYTAIVAEELAAIRKADVAEIARQTTANARLIFGI